MKKAINVAQFGSAQAVLIRQVLLVIDVEEFTDIFDARDMGSGRCLRSQLRRCPHPREKKSVREICGLTVFTKRNDTVAMDFLSQQNTVPVFSIRRDAEINFG